MGAVYLAQHPRLPRRIALKVLADGNGGDAEFRARFIREAEIAGGLAHPNLVAVHDRGIEAETLWIAMQYVEGFDAAQLIKRGPAELTPQRAVHIIAEAARGLDAVHAAGLLHRDVKPANILISPRPDGTDRVLVTDFGIARPIVDSGALTVAGDVLATLAYAASEQLRGAAMDHRVDVYALGCTLYEMLTGNKPFVRETPMALMHAHLSDPPPRPSGAAPWIPRGMDGVIARALAKNPADRYPDCRTLAEAAAAALRGELEPPRRTRRAIGIGAAVAVSVLAAASAVVFTMRSGSEPAALTPVAPVDDSGKPWQQYSLVVETFPDLLPAAPSEPTALGHHCDPHGDDNPDAAIDLPASRLQLTCSHTGSPVPNFLVSCYASGLPKPAKPPGRGQQYGTEQWTRPSGSGHIFWLEAPAKDGTVTGHLRIFFDDAPRNACYIDVVGGTSGKALYDSWWPNAPI